MSSRVASRPSTCRPSRCVVARQHAHGGRGVARESTREFHFVAHSQFRATRRSGDDTATASVTVAASTLANLAVFANYAVLTPNPPLAGQPVTVCRHRSQYGAPPRQHSRDNQELANGRRTAATVPRTTCAWRADDADRDGHSAGRRAHPGAVPGRCEQPGDEFDKSDNIAVIDVDPIALADLVIGSADIRETPHSRARVQTAMVNVSVTNRGRGRPLRPSSCSFLPDTADRHSIVGP